MPLLKTFITLDAVLIMLGGCNAGMALERGDHLTLAVLAFVTGYWFRELLKNVERYAKVRAHA